MLRSFYANAVLIKGKKLKGKDFQKYYKELKKRNVVDNLLDDNLMRKIKKLIIKYFTYFYIKFLIRG